MSALIVLLIATFTPAARAGCPSSNEQIRDHLDVAALAFASSRGAVLASERAAAEAELACLDSQITRENAAAWHQMVALDCSMRGDLDCALRSLTATVAAMPGWQLPDTVVPANHALRELYRQASVASPGEKTRVDVPDGYILVMDGARGLLRPTTEPVLAQAFDPSGRLLWGAWVDVGQDLPDFPQPRRHSPALMVSAGVLLGASGALWLGAQAAADQLSADGAALAENRRGGEQAEATLRSMQDSRDRANQLGLAAQVGAGLAVGLGAVAFTVKF